MASRRRRRDASADQGRRPRQRRPVGAIHAVGEGAGPGDAGSEPTLLYGRLFRTRRGSDPIGPVLSQSPMRTAPDGGYSSSFGFDVILPKRSDIDPKATTIEVIGVARADAGS